MSITGIPARGPLGLPVAVAGAANGQDGRCTHGRDARATTIAPQGHKAGSPGRQPQERRPSWTRSPQGRQRAFASSRLDILARSPPEAHASGYPLPALRAGVSRRSMFPACGRACPVGAARPTTAGPSGLAGPPYRGRQCCLWRTCPRKGARFKPARTRQSASLHALEGHAPSWPATPDREQGARASPKGSFGDARATHGRDAHATPKARRAGTGICRPVGAQFHCAPSTGGSVPINDNRDSTHPRLTSSRPVGPELRSAVVGPLAR